jgi:hypothetical protein
MLSAFCVAVLISLISGVYLEEFYPLFLGFTLSIFLASLHFWMTDKKITGAISNSIRSSPDKSSTIECKYVWKCWLLVADS